MERYGIQWVRILYCIAVVVGCVSEAAQTYVVHVSKSHMPYVFDNHEQWNASTVKSLERVEGKKGEEKIIYINDDKVFNGFATTLSRAQAEALESVEGILGVYLRAPHHMESPRFFGLDVNDGSTWSVSYEAVNVIVGVLDTGAWPESPRISDDGMSHVPSQWKGECEFSTGFNFSHCNKKLIGARFFCKGCEAALGPVNEMKEYRSLRTKMATGLTLRPRLRGHRCPTRA